MLIYVTVTVEYLNEHGFHNFYHISYLYSRQNKQDAESMAEQAGHTKIVEYLKTKEFKV